jgi:trigger factor
MSDLKIALKIDIAELSPILRKLSIELPPTAVDEALTQVYRDLGSTVKVKGFRPGKVPRHVLERTYKADVEREVVAQLIQSSYRQAVDERNLWPVSEPIVENEKLAEGQPFRYSAQVEVKPKLDPTGYEGLPLKPKPTEVTDAELDQELEKLRESMAALEPIEERKVAVAGDWALVDYDLSVDGKPVPNLENNRDQPVELTEGPIIKGHVPELRGVEVGSTVDVTYAFPADYRVADLRGKSGLFKVTLKGLRKRVVPALDDELVKDLDEPELTTVAQLRDRVRTRMLEERKEESDRDASEQLTRAIVEKNPFEAPPALVNRVAEAELRALAQQIVRAGVDPNSLSIDQGKLRASAEQRVKAELLFEAIAEKEKLELSDAELEAHYEKLSKATDKPVAKVKAELGRSGQLGALKYRLLQDKALAFLRSRATIQG